MIREDTRLDSGARRDLPGEKGKFPSLSGYDWLAWIEENESSIWIVLIAAVVLRQWLMSLNATLWLDEAGITWTIGGTWSEVAHRAVQFGAPPQSITFAYFLRLFTSIFGMREWALRLPSLLASLVTLWLFYRLSRLYLDRTAAYFALALWCLSGEIFSLATEARPYAIGLLCTIAGLYQLHRWLTQPSWRNFLLYVLLAGSSSYFVYMFALSLTAHALFILYKLARGAVLPRWQLVTLIPLWVLLLAPLIPALRAIGDAAALHSVPKPSGFRDSIVIAWIPPTIAACHLGAWLFGRFVKVTHGRRSLPLDAVVLSILFLACTTIPLYVITKYTHATLWTYRYMASMSFALAILHCGILISYTSGAARCFGVLCIGMFVFPTIFSVTHFWPRKASVDYRAVAQEIARQRQVAATEVFMGSEFVEGWTYPFPASDYDKGWLLAPFILYSTNGPVEVIPNDRRQAAESYFRNVRSKVQAANRIIYFGPAMPGWFEEILNKDFVFTALGNERAFGLFERKRACLGAGRAVP